MQPLVSVVVPTYNRAYCVADTIESVLNQTYSAVEVIVVDDGSTDETRDVIERLYSNEPRVRYIYQRNQHVAAARNTGMIHAKGEFIALLDSDDTWEPWKLELQIACMQMRPEVGMTWTDMRAIDPDGRITEEHHIRTYYSAYRWFTMDGLFRHSFKLSDVSPSLSPVVGDALYHTGDIFSEMIMGSLVHTSTVVMRRERMEQVGWFNPALRPLGEDYDYHLRTCFQGPVGFLDLTTVNYQRGMADRLTRPDHEVAIAENFLKTISPYIENRRSSIKLDKRMIRAVLAEAHDWVADTRFTARDRAQARYHYAMSLRYKPLQIRVALFLLLAAFPSSMEMMVRKTFRSLRGLLVRQPQVAPSLPEVIS